MFVFFFFKQKTAYEMRISDWSSDVCSSDLFRQSILPPSPPLLEVGIPVRTHSGLLLKRVDGRTSVPLAITNQRDIGYFRPIRQRRWIRLLSRAAPGSRNASGVDRKDRKSKRLNSSH